MAPRSKKSARGDNNHSDFQVCESDIPLQPSNLEVGLNLIFLALTEPYLTPDQCIEFKVICRRALSPEHRQDAKAQLLELYPRSTVMDTGMRAKVADAAIFLIQATASLEQGYIDAAQTYMAQASAILPKLEKRRIHQRDKLSTQEECIQRFAKRLLEIRPKDGWRNIDQAAAAGQAELQTLLDEYRLTFGLLWKVDPGTLVLQWLQQKQPYVHEAYHGRSTHVSGD